MDVRKLAELEALLFASDESITLQDLSRASGLKSKELLEYLKVLQKEYDKESHGLTIKKYNDSYLITTKPEHVTAIQELHKKGPITRLSQAALETLAIIAYKQPVTRAEIEEIRGVKAEKTLLTLNKYGLIQELGRMETIGNPIVYGTTKTFLKQFDLEDLSQLPIMDEEE